MKHILSLVAFFATLQASAQQVNPVPDYVFRNQMSVGRNAVTDTAAYFSIGPRYGATKGFMPPIVSDTASVNANKRNGLLIFSVQKNKFLYWDSVRVQWSDMAGSSGSYITGKGITGYVPQYTDTATLDTSALYTLGNQLGIGTSSFVYSGSGRTVVELNGTAGGLYGFKRNDSAKGYLFHNGDNMELANTVAGSISFNTNSATRGSIASDGVWRLHNLAGTGDRVVVASSNGTLSASTSVTGLVDTLTISTRAWRQKGIDSVVSIIPAAGVGGSGTTNYVPKFTAASTIGNSQIVDNAASGVNIGAKTTIRDDGPFITGGNISAAGNNFAIGTTGGSALMMFTNSTQRVQIASDGTVGINATGALLPLTVYNPTLNTPVLEVRGGGGSSQTRINMSFGNATSSTLNGDIFASTTDFALRAQDGRNLWFGTTSSGIFGNRMQIHSNGRIGINTTTDAGYQLDVAGSLRTTTGANFATTSGNVGIGTASPTGFSDKIVNIYGATSAELHFTTAGTGTANSDGFVFSIRDSDGLAQIMHRESAALLFGTGDTEAGRINSSREWLLSSGGTDAGDYKLQVVGNARVGTGKLDIASNTTFGIGIARSGTSEVAGQIYNSNGILYLGAESSAGGQIFTGSSAYAAVIGSGANYPLQFATNNATRATINTNGELLINTTTDNGDFKLQVNGNALISGSIKTANGGSSTAQPWHLGSVVATSVQLDTNNYVEVEINGVYYRLAIVTPL